jgi:hypothetical protein
VRLLCRDQGNQAITNAAQQDSLDIVMILIADPRVNHADQDTQAIINAARKNNLETVKSLLAILEDERLDPRIRENLQIRSAIEFETQKVENSSL